MKKQEREEQINFILNMITELCKEYQIALLPARLNDKEIGLKIIDNTNKEEYWLAKK